MNLAKDRAINLTRVSLAHQDSIRAIFYCGLLCGTNSFEFKKKWRKRPIISNDDPGDLVVFGRIAGVLDGYCKDELPGIVITPRMRGAALRYQHRRHDETSPLARWLAYGLDGK